jgi:RNA polymerase sigma factor (sigma-70 family)
VNSLTNQQLLRDYCERRSETAFSELVRRHVDFVYSAVLRMVCNAQLAEDVTQGVFVAFAQNARQLTDHAVLSGWLHRTAQNLAANAVRSEVRRRGREQEAATMNELLAPEPDTAWEQLAPHLDAALGELGDADRVALLLRYFERKSAREMAQTLGVSEDAAQRRVSRAVERLRESFAKRGVAVGASGLVVAITANAVQAAPVGLAVTISTAAALAGTAVATTATATAIKTIAMTTLQKTLITVTITASVGTGIYEYRQASTLRTQVQSLEQQSVSLAEEIQQLNRDREAAAMKLAALRDGNERLKNNITELPKLRGDVTQLRQQLATQNRQADRPLGYIAKDKIAFAGRATPEAALETITWAHLNGTYDQFIEALSSEMLAQEELKGTKRREMFETNKIKFAPFFNGVQILAKKVLTDDRVELKYKNDLDPAVNQLLDMPKSGPLPQFIVQAMVKVGNDWKMDGLPRLNEESWDDEGQIEKFAP